MFGIVFAMLNRSACSARRGRRPAASSGRTRSSGRRRCRRPSPRWRRGCRSVSRLARVRGPGRRHRRRRRAASSPVWCLPRTRRNEAYGDRAEQQRDADAEDHPDHLADLDRPDRQVVRRTERGALLVGDEQLDVVHAEPVRGRLEEDGGAALGREVDRLGRVDRERLRRSAMSLTVTGWSSRLVTVAANRAAGAGQGDRPRRLDLDRAEPAAIQARARRRPGGVRVGGGRRRTGRQRLVGDRAATVSLRVSTFCSVSPVGGQRGRRGEVGGVELAAGLRAG